MAGIDRHVSACSKHLVPGGCRECNDANNRGEQVLFAHFTSQEAFARAIAEKRTEETRTMIAGEKQSKNPLNPKEAMGATKPPLALIPASANIHEAQAFGYGAYRAPRKDGGFGYGPYNWRESKVSAMTYINAMKRHIDDYLDGQDYAEDSGAHHLGHARACAAILLDAMECGTLVDDRPLPGKAPEILARFTVKS